MRTARVRSRRGAASRFRRCNLAAATPIRPRAPAPRRRDPEGMMADNTVTVRQTGSPIRREAYQRQTLIGLGLNKINRTRKLPDNPAVRGMIERVKHLVVVEDPSSDGR